MIHKKTIIALGIVTAFTITGVSMAATHSNPPVPTVAKTSSFVQNKAMETNNDDEVQVITIPNPEPKENVTIPAPTEPVAPPEIPTNPVEAVQQTILAQAAGIAPFFARADDTNFINRQWTCLSRGITVDSPQSEFDRVTSFLLPKPFEDGRQTYSYFDGGCRVITVYR